MEAHERVAVERFCRYALRGPIANGRLSKGPRELLTYRLKTPKPDGTTALVLSPMALLERLSRLIPQHGRHMVTYHGVLASAARWRSRIVPESPPELSPLLRRTGSRRIDWANLLRRVFMLEVLACACGGSRRVISSIEEGPAARRILKHLGLPAEAPSAAPARIGQGELFPTGPPPSDACEPTPVDTFECAASNSAGPAPAAPPRHRLTCCHRPRPPTASRRDATRPSAARLRAPPPAALDRSGAFWHRPQGA